MPPKPKKKFAMNWGESTQEGEKEKDKEKDKEIDTSVMPMFSKPKKQFAMNWGESTQEKEKDKEINTSVMPMFSKPKKKFAMNWDDNTKIENQQPIKQEIPVSTTISKELREQADDSQQFKLLQQQQHQQQINLMKMNWGDDPDITTSKLGERIIVKQFNQLQKQSTCYAGNIGRIEQR
ncbi:MAG: hypothetical protein EZS28_010038 [Streblomastix strix]|uniref:Uncharacterized protein n=1 Tax=Streblomastix strix TaxID=222440 RepID=A0A5J4WJG8_9EUKA|nr:MAG: hypothetical protein EZS28_010038 [Streblomastix strix]